MKRRRPAPEPRLILVAPLPTPDDNPDWFATLLRSLRGGSEIRAHLGLRGVGQQRLVVLLVMMINLGRWCKVGELALKGAFIGCGVMTVGFIVETVLFIVAGLVWGDAAPIQQKNGRAAAALQQSFLLGTSEIHCEPPGGARVTPPVPRARQKRVG